MNYQYFKEDANSLKANFKFKHFKEAFAFMTEVAFAAESINHHPNWSNVYNQVNLELTTHDAGNTITELDHKLAKKVEQIAQKHL
jgi:4a-hydroxytetrahydrobiopterin dehydratase